MICFLGILIVLGNYYAEEISGPEAYILAFLILIYEKTLTIEEKVEEIE